MAACQVNCTETRDLALDASPLYGSLVELAREGYTVAELHTRRRNASTSKEFYDSGGLTTRNVGSERERRKA